jgi:hypothetical protein
LVDKNPLPEWKPAVLEVFVKAEEKCLRNAVGNAAYHLCDPLECVELKIGLTDDPGKAKCAVESLTGILHNVDSRSSAADLDTSEKRQKCKAAWLTFLAANRDKLKLRQPFSLKDPLPLAELFPGIRFDSRD